ncbi:rod-binding protein [Paracoccus indicus]|uniref:rod-binding protein n=1 Tax=Paracoccus indicus TaxID=2079229 RepID=UPI000D3B9402|nr:rod-binding protein [Paracoccus indicus]
MKIEPIVPAQTASPRAVVESKLEQAFLEEMLKYCGPTSMKGEFSGGAGEDQFNSFLTREYATSLAGRLDLGLSRSLGRAAS